MSRFDTKCQTITMNELKLNKVNLLFERLLKQCVQINNNPIIIIINKHTPQVKYVQTN